MLNNNINNKKDLIFSNFGKVQPQAIDIEEIVLGAILLERDALNEVIDILIPDSFYKESHQKIYSSILDLFKLNNPIDLLTVTEKLKSKGELEFVGGPYYITLLTSRIASSANIEYHARIIQEKYIAREIIKISSNAIIDAYDDITDIFELQGKIELDLSSITEKTISKRCEKINKSIKSTIKDIIYLKENPTKFTGIPTGFIEIDKKTGGWQNSDLIIIAGRPGMGKTTFALSSVINACNDGISCGFFSLEMSSDQLNKKILSEKFEIELSRINQGKITDFEVNNLLNYNDKILENLYIDDTPSLSIIQLRAKARRLKRKYDIKFIVIDYLQLMNGSFNNKNNNREQEISNISRSLKSLAKELNIPVIALSQLSRDVEKRGGSKRPILSDLRESGSIEQDSDIVIFIYRPEYYKIEYFEDNISTQGIAEVLIAKGRNIGTGDYRLKFQGNISKFSNLYYDDLNTIENIDDETYNPF